MARLILIPTPISVSSGQLPHHNRELLATLDYFVVENIRTARRFLATQKLPLSIDQMTFVELSEHTDPTQIEAMLEPVIKEGRSCGVISEAGLPCVADPGAAIVQQAHKHNIEVVPLVGPSSIMLALMASGMNGQSFAFNGYIPIKEPNRTKAISNSVNQIVKNDQTQIFIETPYRNNSVMDSLLKQCPVHISLCVAQDLMGANQRIEAMTIAHWRHNKRTLSKEPTIFILGN